MLGRKKFKLPRISSIIAEHNTIKGDLHFSGGLHLDGRVQGDVVGQRDTNSSLIISKSGSVKGNVRVINLVLGGTIVGDVEAENKVQLMQGSRVTGTVRYRVLEMAEGAEVNGKLVYVDEEKPRLLEHALQEPQNDQVDLTRKLHQTTSKKPLDAGEWTSLMKAALNGHSQVVEHMLAEGADSDLMDKGGYTALMLAASNNHVQIVDLLAAAGANPNQVESTNGRTALIWAAKRGHRETVIKLLALGADPHLLDHKGLSAHEWALQEGHAEVAGLLR